MSYTKPAVVIVIGYKGGTSQERKNIQNVPSLEGGNPWWVDQGVSLEKKRRNVWG